MISRRQRAFTALRLDWRSVVASGPMESRCFGARPQSTCSSNHPEHRPPIQPDTTSQRRSYERHWTPVHLDFVVDEIEPAVQRAMSAGARLEQPVSTYKWGKLALMADPFGHGFCFVQFLGRGYD